MTVSSSKPDQRADQFQGTQCEGTVSVFWQPVGLVGWFWRPINAKAGHGPFMSSRLALLAAILEGHVHYSGATHYSDGSTDSTRGVPAGE